MRVGETKPLSRTFAMRIDGQDRSFASGVFGVAAPRRLASPYTHMLSKPGKPDSLRSVGGSGEEPSAKQTVPDRLAIALLPVAWLAALLGGCVFWLRRVGLLEPDRYWKTVDELIAMSPSPDIIEVANVFVMAHLASMHELQGWLLLTKTPKHLVVLSFVLLALWKFAASRTAPRPHYLFSGLFLLGAHAALISTLSGGWYAIAAGARAFAPWILAAFSAPLLSKRLLTGLVHFCVALLVTQGLLVGYELAFGSNQYFLAPFGHVMPRVVGSFNIPISLGVTSLAAWSCVYCWGALPTRTLRLLTLLAFLILAVNASLTVWAAAGLIGLQQSFARLPARFRPLLLAAALPATLVALQVLPTVTGRNFVMDSLWGRVVPVVAHAEQDLTSAELLFGSGFGLGTNALTHFERPAAATSAAPNSPFGDSLPASLLWQFGLTGSLLVYALFALAFWKNPRSRPLAIALIVGSAGVNLTELFPVNLLLGFWLADSLTKGRNDQELNETS